MKHSVILGITMAALVFFGAGCNSDCPPEDLSGTVPGAASDPTGAEYNNNTSLKSSTGDAFAADNATPGKWEDPAAVGAVDKDGWRIADPSGNRLNMPIIYFAYDSDALVPSETQNLDKIAEYLGKNPALGLVIEGHCDQRGTEEYNRALGERRANAIRAYLVKRGVPEAKLKTLSFGKDKLAVTGDGESFWKQNRRGIPVPMVLPQR